MSALSAWEEAEQKLLQAALRHPAVLDAVVLDHDQFSRESHRLLWLAMQALRKEGRPATIDIVEVFVAGRLSDDSRLPQFRTYLRKLVSMAQDTVLGVSEAVDLARTIEQFASVRRAKEELQNLLLMAEGNDPRVLDELPAALARIGGTHDAHGDGREWPVLLSDTMDGIENIMDGNAPPSVPTGITQLNRLGLFVPGKLIIVGARPGMGKSALALRIATAAALHREDDGQKNTPRQHHVLFVSLEMSAEELTQRALSMRSKVPLSAILGGWVRDDWEKLNNAHRDMGSWHLKVAEMDKQTLEAIAAAAKRHKATYGLDLLVIDYLQLIDVPPSRNGSRAEDVAGLSRGLKRLARELSCPILALAQLNRGANEESGQRPTLANLRESGGQENDADAVLLLSPILGGKPFDEWAQQDKRDVLCDVRKNRSGPMTDIRLVYNGPIVSFGEP